MKVALVIAFLVVASVALHLFTPWWMTDLASNWKELDDTILITFWITGIVFIAVNLFMAYCIVRFRHRKGHQAHYEPENASLEKWLTIWTAVGVAALLAPGLLAWQTFIAVPKDAAIVEVVGEQWRWTYRFPGPDGVLGTANAKFITAENTFGLNPADPYGKDDILVENATGELHLPVGQSYKFMLRSKDVLHDFYVPQFRSKMDMVPGVSTYFWAKPTVAGSYEVLCAELCGTGHHNMRGRVVVEEQAAFQAWLAEYPTFGQILSESQGVASNAAPAGRDDNS